ncbi:hypothetical protein PFISCL1PPCAC_20247 [Pristionchus fissidentatus]|uniref:Uncharacterized protein n=1 Tax=Pristionchus fissidentatus TaxID=1538716 RepID=A0AAV5WEQ9_9BILA|nr:hypothetical protein PFISCL1PPCAC_20247 [Pristionchus fissidentatus]
MAYENWPPCPKFEPALISTCSRFWSVCETRFQLSMNLKMQRWRHCRSELESEVPGEVMHFWVHFSERSLMRFWALAIAACCFTPAITCSCWAGVSFFSCSMSISSSIT